MLTDLWRAKYEIERFLCRAQQWRGTRDGVPIDTFESRCMAVSCEFGKLILSLWGDDFAESWRIDDYQITTNRLQLQLSRQAGRQRVHLELWPLDTVEELPADIRQRRLVFQQRLCQLIRQTFPGAVIERVATQRDDARQLSGVYTRTIVSLGQERCIAIGVNPQESQSAIDGLLTAGIIWFDRASRRLRGRANRLALLSPAGRSTKLARRLTAIRPPAGVSIELYEVDEASAALRPVRPFDQGSLFDPVRHRLPRASEPTPINALVDHVLRDRPELKVYRRPGRPVQSLRVHGLEVAQLSGGKLRFGLGDNKQLLESNDLTPLNRLIEQVARIRRAQSEQKWHALYRQQAERWLEEMIRQNVQALDVNLDARYIYPQVPTLSDDEYDLVDLLAITEAGRLVVIELKVKEDMELPLQALDYWLQVEWHRQRGDFQRRGYFPDRQLSDEPALLFLVCPLLRFHRTFDLIAHWIDRRIPAYKIGINENWRNGVKVLIKEHVHG